MENHEPRVTTPETAGAYLRNKRMSRNIALEEVSGATGISVAVLQALENEDREQLPAEVYVKAFYKKYAEFLGVEPEKIQAKYQQQPRKQKKAGRGYDFSTVVTLKDQEENLFLDILRRVFLPVAIFILGILLYWIYRNYLAPYHHSLGLYREHFPAVFSFLSAGSLHMSC